MEFCLASLTIGGLYTVTIRKVGLAKGRHAISALTISAS